MPIIEGEFRRILVRATNWVGDAVMSLPALQALRERFPDAHIAVLARPWVADIYARETFANEVIAYTLPRGWKDLGAKWRVAQEIRKRVLRYRDPAAERVRGSGDGLARRYSEAHRLRARRQGISADDAVQRPAPGEIPRHERFYYLELLRRAGIIETLPTSEQIRLGGAAAARAGGLREFAALGLHDVTGVSPGAAFGTAKRWLPERFAEAVDATRPCGALFGSQG